MNNGDLLKAIAQLARSSPSAWEEFLAKYRVHCTEVLKQVISSPPDSLHVAQGRAKHSDELLRWFESAVATTEQIERRK